MYSYSIYALVLFNIINRLLKEFVNCKINEY